MHPVEPTSEDLNRNHLTEALAQLEPLWGVLTGMERTKLVNPVGQSTMCVCHIGRVGWAMRFLL